MQEEQMPGEIKGGKLCVLPIKIRQFPGQQGAL
jgi:hypothetical protein